DMALKGRHAGARRAMPRGDDHWTHRHPERIRRTVNEETAQAIAACPGSFRSVGRQFGVSHKVVSKIKAGTYFGSSAGSKEKNFILSRK
ncbi:MAG: hypothetical protein ACRC1H_01205, partial [Caldilineaceae bacterium]